MPQRLNVSFEIKALNNREVEGHGSIFRNRDLGDDIVLPGAFKKTLARHKAEGALPLMFWMHDPAQVPGLWTEMAEDREGLYVKGELVETQLGNEMHTLLQKKAVRGLSIGYRTIESEYDKDGNRLLKELDLWEVSIVSLAMNPLAQVEAVKARLSRDGEYVPTEREFERLLRDAGCSRKVATILVAKLYDPDAISGMLDDHERDARTVEDPEAEAAIKAILQLTDKVGAAALTR